MASFPLLCLTASVVEPVQSLFVSPLQWVYTQNERVA